MASRGSEAQRLCKRDQPINAYVWRDIYSVGDRKQDSVQERNVDGETTDRYRDGDASKRDTLQKKDTSVTFWAERFFFLSYI